MKKFIGYIFIALCLSTPGVAENIMFGERQNQIGIYIGQSTGGSSMLNLVWPGWWEYQPFQYYMVQYSQPTEFFRLPARRNLHFGYTVGFGKHDGEDWRDYSWPMFNLSFDVALIQWRNFYAGAGFGIGIKWDVDARQDSRFVFGEKVMIGYRINERFSAELFTQHYSNGNLTPVNSAYNFAGVSVLYNF